MGLLVTLAFLSIRDACTVKVSTVPSSTDVDLRFQLSQEPGNVNFC